MLLRHATPRRNLDSIGRQGLLADRSKGKIKAVWLHTLSKTPWAVIHVARRHKARLENTVIIEVDVPRSWLKRGHKSLWYVCRDIPPERFLRLIDVSTIAASPVINL